MKIRFMNSSSSPYFRGVAVSIALVALIVLAQSCGSDSEPAPPPPPASPQVTGISPTSGLTNTAVVITGANFSTVIAENKVTFNGKEAVITLATATQLTVTVPLLAETGAVAVTTKNLAASNQPVFTVESPTPEVTQISPTFGLTNIPVTITGTNFSTVLSENVVTFKGKNAVVTAATATQLTVTVPLLSETGPVAVTVKGKAAASQPVFTVLVVPVLTTTAVKDIIQTTAVGGGIITSEGGSPVTARGICWSTKENPTILDNKTTNGTGAGTFTSPITGLTVGVTYHVRAYATNNFGTAYGNDVTFKSPPLLGVAYQGGIIAYILQAGDPGYVEGESHGLIAYKSDYVLVWGSATVETGATGKALGTGLANTTTIVGIQGGGTSSAAGACFSLSEGIYEDWYLPSKDELNKLYLARDVIGGFSTTGYYWTSTEAGLSSAWIQSFSTAVQSTYDKKGSFNVRAIRAF